MSRFDLNNIGDFSRLTMGSAASILQTLALAGRDPTKWDILEASFISQQTVDAQGNNAQPVIFHVFTSKTDYQAAVGQVTDQAGRRKVKYLYPYRDGQTTDDLGKAPSSFSFDCVLHGNRYMQGYTALLSELNKPTPGTLVHPILGPITVVFENLNVTHTHSQRKAVQFTITFIEHNFTIGNIREFEDKTTKGFLSKCLEAFSTIDRIVTNVTGAIVFVKSLRNQIVQSLQDYKNKYGDNLSKINRTFNKRGSFDIPGLLPVNADRGDVFPVVTSPNDQLSAVDTSVSNNTSIALATASITQDVITTRQLLASIILLMNTGRGSLEFFDDIIALKGTAILLQNALEIAIASSRSQINEYTVPRVMSLREVCFANSIPVNRVIELDQLNPSLLSTNFIAIGTLLKVPSS